MYNFKDQNDQNKDLVPNQIEEDLYEDARITTILKTRSMQSLTYTEDEWFDAEDEDPMNFDNYEEDAPFDFIDEYVEVSWEANIKNLNTQFKLIKKQYPNFKNYFIQPHKKYHTYINPIPDDVHDFTDNLLYVIGLRQSTYSLLQQNKVTKSEYYHALVLFDKVMTDMLVEIKFLLKRLNQQKYYMPISSKDYICGIVEHAYDVITSKRVNKHKLYMRTQDVMKSHRYTHPYIKHSNNYIIPSRTRQQQREVVMSDFCLFKSLLPSKPQKFSSGFKIYERKNTVVVQNTKTRQKKTMSKDLTETNTMEFSRQLKLEASPVYTNSLITQIRDYFIQNTATGKMLTASCWHHVAASLVQIILHLIQIFKGGSKTVSIIGIILAVTTFMNSFAALAGLGVCGDTTKFEKLLDNKVKLHILDMLTTLDGTNGFNPESVDAVVEKVKVAIDPTSEVIETESKSTLQENKDMFDKEFNKAKLTITHQMYQVPQDIIDIETELIEEISEEHPQLKPIVNIKPSALINMDVSYLPYFTYQTQATSTYHNDCLYHSLVGTYNGKHYYADTDTLKQQINIQSVDELCTSEEINLISLSISEKELNKMEQLQLIVDTCLSEDLKSVELLTYLGRLFKRKVYLFIDNNFSAPHIYNMLDDEYVFINFNSEEKHFERVEIKQTNLLNSQDLYNINIKVIFETIEKYIKDFQMYNSKHAKYLIDGYRKIVDAYNTLVLTNNTKLEFGENITREKICQYAITGGVNILAMTIALWSAVTDPKMGAKSLGNRIVEFTSVARCTKTELTETYDLVAELMSDLFGICISPDTVNRNMLHNHIEKLQYFNGIKINKYVADAKLYISAKKYVEVVEKDLNMLMTRQRVATQGYVNTEKHIRSMLVALQSKLRTSKECINQFLTRQETLPVRIYGAHGAGKTEYATKFLNVSVADKLGIVPTVCNLNFGDNKFYPILKGEQIMVYDEFLARRDEDPLIADFNSIHSSNLFSLDAADVAFKNQPCNFLVSFLIANTAYEDLAGGMNHEAVRGFYSRFYDIHFVNTKQTSDTHRIDIPRGTFTDVEHYEYREYVDVASKDRNCPLVSSRTVVADTAYNKTTDEYDDTVYGAGKNKYRLKTHKQVVDEIVRRIKRFETSYKTALKQEAEFYLKKEFTKSSTTEEHREFLEAKGYPEDVVAAVLDKFQLESDVNDALDHFVINVRGQGGTGKSTMSKQCSTYLSQITGMPFIIIRDLKQSTINAIRKPSIIVLEDCVYEENRYINFYDTIPKPSILFVTHNLPIKRVPIPIAELGDVNSPDLKEQLNKRGEGGFFAKTFNAVLSYLIKKRAIMCWEIESIDNRHINGFARRLGLPGNHSHGGMISKRPLTSCMLVTTASGYKTYENIIDDKEIHYNELTTKEMAHKVYEGFRGYCKSIGEPEIIQKTQQEVQDIVDTITHNGSLRPDVYVQAPTLKELISLTNTPSKMMRTYVKFGSLSKEGYKIEISDRVVKSAFDYDMLDFAIPTNTKPEDAKSVALLMYRLLLSGNTSFTCHITCKEFQAICKDGVVNYALNAKIDRTGFEHQIVGNNVEFTYVLAQADQPVEKKVIWTVTKEEFIDRIINGFEKENLFERQFKFDEALDFMSYCHVVSRESEFADLMFIATSKQSLTIENAQEKIRFFKIWDYFKETVAYKIILIIAGLFTAFIIGALIKMFIDFIMPKDKDNKGTMIVVLDDDKKAECIYTYDLIQGLEDNFDEIEARFQCDIVDYDYDEMSRSTFRRRFIENIINCVKPRDEKLKYVNKFTLDSVTLQSSKTNKVQQSKVVSRPLMFEKLEGKHTLYAGAKQTKVQENKQRAVNLVKLEGGDKMSEDITNIIEDNVCIVRTYDKFGILQNTMYGVVLKERVVLTMYHSICRSTGGSLNPMETYTQTAQFVLDPQRKQYPMQTLLRDKANDSLFCEIIDKTCAHKKDITHFFLNDKDRPTPEVEFRTYDLTNKFVTRNVYWGITRSQNLAFDTINLKEGAKTYLTTVYNTIGFVTKPGDCGLPLLSKGMSAPRTILGLHYGKSMGYLTANCVTQEYLTKEVYPRLISLESHVVDTPYDPKESVFKFSEITFTGPDGNIEQVAVDDTTKDLIINSYDAEELRFECLNSGERTKYIGYTESGARSNRLKPKYVPTPYSDEVAKYKPNLERNSVTDNREVVDPSALPKDGRGKPSILIGQQNKLNDPVDAEGGPLGVVHLKTAQRLISDHYVANYGKYKHRLLTDLETINGLCINPRDNFYQNLEKIAMDGAAGADLAAKFHIGQKRDLFTVCTDISPSGRSLHVFNNTEAAKYVQEQQLLQLHYWSKDMRFESLVQSNLKCELRPIEKVEKGKTRCFESFTTATSNNVRKLLGTQFAAYKMERHNMFGQVGIDTTDFNQLYMRFKRVGCYGENGDFSAWDKHLLEDVIVLVPEIWTNVFFAQWDMDIKENQEFRQEYFNCMKQIAISNYKSLIIADGHIFTKIRGNCSGSQTTTMLNGIVNDLYRVACILHLAEQHNLLVGKMPAIEIKKMYINLYINYPDLQMLVETSDNIHESIEISSITQLLAITDWINYGDDVCSVIASQYLWFLNFPRLKQAYQYLFGIEYDLPSKDGGIQTYIPLTEMSFISRTLHYDEDLCVVTPRLKESSIQRLLHWTTANTYQQLFTNIMEIFDEVVMYDITLYNQYKAIVNRVVNPYLQKTFGAQITVPDYYSKRNLFVRQALNRGTQRNISNAILAREIDNNNNIISIDALRKIFDKIILQGSEVTTSICVPVNNKMNTYYTKHLPHVRQDVEAVINYFPRNVEIDISGSPALITNRERQQVWSISFNVAKKPLPLMEYERLFKRNIETSGINYKLIGVFEVDILIQTPEKRIQIQLQHLPNRAVQVLENKRATDFTKLQSAEGAPLDIKPQETPGVPLITPTSGLPGILPGMEYSQKSCAALAHTYAPLVSYQLTVGSTEGKVIFNMQHKDLVNELMTLSKKGDSKFFGSFVVKVENSANMGLTGTLIIGTTRTKLEAPTEFDLLEKTYFQLDAVTRNVVELTIGPYADGVPKTVFNWPPTSDSDKNFPSLVCIVKSDFVSTFANDALYSQLHLYTKFSPDFRTYYTGLPSTVVSRNVRPEIVAGFSIDVNTILGKNARFYTDGGYYVNLTQQPRNLSGTISLSGELRSFVQSDWMTKYRDSSGSTSDFVHGIFYPIEGLLAIKGTFKAITGSDMNEFDFATLDMEKYGGTHYSHITFSMTNVSGPTKFDVDYKPYKDGTITRNVYHRGSPKDTVTVRLSKGTVSYKYSDEVHSTMIDNMDYSNVIGNPYVGGDDLLSTRVTTHGRGDKNRERADILKNVQITYNNKGELIGYEFDWDTSLDYILTGINTGTGLMTMAWERSTHDTQMWVSNAFSDLRLIADLLANVEFAVEDFTEVGSLNTDKTVLVPVGGSSLNVITAPNVVPPANEVTTQLGQPTIFPDVDLYSKLEAYFGDKIYLVDVKTISFNQTLFSFIYHGEQKCCFLNTRKVEYLVGTETSENLIFSVRAMIPKGGQLPITTYESSSMYPRTGTMLTLQKQANVAIVEGKRIQNLTSVRLEGAAAAALGGGLSGIGQGIMQQSFVTQNYEQQMKMLLMQNGFKGAQLDKQLQQQMELLKYQLSGQSAMIEQQFGNSKELLQMQNQLGVNNLNLQNSIRNMNNPGFMMQKQRNAGLGLTQPFDYGGIIQNEGVADQFDLQTGKKELAQRINMPKVNEHIYDYPLHRPLPAIPTDQTRQLPDLPEPELYANPAELRHPVPDEPDVFTRAAMPDPEPGYANAPLQHRPIPDVPEVLGKPQLALPSEPHYANELAGLPKAPIPQPREDAYVNNPNAIAAVRDELATESEDTSLPDFRQGQADSPGGMNGPLTSRVFTPTQKAPTIRPPYTQLAAGQLAQAVKVGNLPAKASKKGAKATITPTTRGGSVRAGEMPSSVL